MVASEVGGGSRSWGGEAEKRGGGRSRERGRSERGSRGVPGTLGCLQRRAGKQEVAGALGRAPRLGPSGEEEDVRGGGVEMGWAGFCSRPHR